ncbi:MAG TPA: glycine--tRNA ligase [Phycisphaerales bacterium]|nr:glycine--tRNA ligase [Phycisphaerales bacterium]HRQ74473.1 glycine--tRNA ligase [Phycisphaerales bacterium]
MSSHTDNSPDVSATPAAPATKSMDEIVALCRRRGFIFQSSEIYGGINGFWDYGPLGAQLKRNLKDAWWEDIVRKELIGPDGKPVDMVGLDTTIIMHPKVWEASGHVAGFNDPMVGCKTEGCKKLYRADKVFTVDLGSYPPGTDRSAEVGVEADSKAQAEELAIEVARRFKVRHESNPEAIAMSPLDEFAEMPTNMERFLCPNCQKRSLTPPRAFNLMFESHAGAIQSEDNKVYLRPETAQGIFVNFWNVVDTSRVRIPFGIAQQGKAFRNEVTPRNFTFRSREFEQMEIEFFIHPSQADEWYAFWRDNRYQWWQSIGLAGDNLQLREHDKDELAHYAKDGAGTSDIEYRFPFTAPGFGELEGVAHRADFDLKAHANACGKGEKMRYFDQEKNERYFPHVIEPSAGADRGTLALLCEAYTKDDSRASGVFMKFNPRLAPIKAAVFPLVNKDGMPEVAEKLYRNLRKRWTVEYDPKQSIGKRYARMDEAGTPFCFTIDGDSLNDHTVTVRHRDTQQQERIAIDQVERFIADRLETTHE